MTQGSSGSGGPGKLLTRGFYPALRCVGLYKIRFHHLRHTYASLLIANGEHPKRIQALMGHSSINVTMDVYGHLMPGGGGEVADRLGALVSCALRGALFLRWRGAREWRVRRGYRPGTSPSLSW